MTERILANEAALRLGFFLGILGLMALWELLAARRELQHSQWRRRAANFGVAAIDALLVRRRRRAFPG